jgi:hypothetical protein
MRKKPWSITLTVSKTRTGWIITVRVELKK